VDIESLLLGDRLANELSQMQLYAELKKIKCPRIKPDMSKIDMLFCLGIQAFLDGNKRTSSVVSATFLLLNGYDFIASADAATRLEIWKMIGAGRMSEAEVGAWLRANIVKV
jgi:prophage maintenance system killer protein